MNSQYKHQQFTNLNSINKTLYYNVQQIDIPIHHGITE